MKEILIKVVDRLGEIFKVPPGGKVFNKEGEEIPDPTPVEMPLGFEHPEPLEMMMARLVRQISYEQGRAGEETIEESDDFDIDDEEDFSELLTDSELRAMNNARELKEEMPQRDYDEAKRNSRDTGGSEEDGDFDEGAGRRSYSRGDGEAPRERDDSGSESRGEEVDDRRTSKPRRVAEDREVPREGTVRKKLRR